MGQGDRVARVAERIQREVAGILLERVSDPGLRGVTVTQVEVSRDVRHARIVVAGPRGADRRALETRLARVRPFVQRELAGRLDLRYAVELVFRLDEGFDRAERLLGLFEEVAERRSRLGLPPDATPEDASGADGSDGLREVEASAEAGGSRAGDASVGGGDPGEADAPGEGERHASGGREGR